MNKLIKLMLALAAMLVAMLAEANNIDLGYIDLAPGETVSFNTIVSRHWYYASSKSSSYDCVFAQVRVPSGKPIICKIEPDIAQIASSIGNVWQCTNVYSQVKFSLYSADTYTDTFCMYKNTYSLQQAKAIAIPATSDYPYGRTYYVVFHHYRASINSSSQNTYYNVSFTYPIDPAQPSYITAQKSGAGIQVSWGASQSATSYRLYKYCNGAFVTKWDRTDLSYYDSDVSSGNTYQYYIDARNDYGTSEMLGSTVVNYSTTSPGGGGSSGGDAKYALCVGINKYSLSVTTLNGCVNDAVYFRSNLVARGGWSSSNAQLLNDSSATKVAIRSAMASFAARAVPGDTFIYYHSSHGGQNSGTSVFLCCHNGYYEDTELAEDLSLFQSGVKVVVIVDACRSGGLFKSLGEAPSFDLAERVSLLVDQMREDKITKGEKDVASKISSQEIGWVTAADYDENSKDGGCYDSSAWLTDWSKYWFNVGGVCGGAFAGAFTWGWWNGLADTTGAGDNDGYMDAYEGYKYSHSILTSLSLSTPQYLNASVLRSVELGTSGGSGGSGSSAPANDNFSNATQISGASGTLTGSNVGATVQSSEPMPSAQSNSKCSVWFKWTAPSSGTVTFDTIGSSFDTVLGVYTGTSVSSLSEVDSDDDGGDGTTSKVSFKATSGTIYRIAVYGFNGKSGSITLNWSLAAQVTKTVSFVVNGGSSCADREYIVGGAYGTLPTTSKTGYAFDGWYTSSTFTTEVTSSSTVSSSVSTLYAKWTPNNYTISYNYDGGTKGSNNPSSGTYDKAFYVSAPTKSGHTFAGWTVTNGLNTSTAKYGTTSSSQTTSITSSSKKCLNGATGDVWFKNLRATTGSVTLTANWTCSHASTSLQNALAATCTTAGYTGDRVCSTCGAVIATGTTIPALGHNEGAGVVTKEPTTTEDGVMTYSCTRCGIVMRTEAIPKITPTWHIDGAGVLTGVDLNGVTEIVIPDDVSSIGAGVFSNCCELTSVAIPSSVTSIGNNAFYGCSNILEVNIQDLKSWFNIAFYNAWANPIAYGNAVLKSNGVVVEDVVVPSETTEVQSFVFYGYKHIRSVSVHDNVDYIGWSAFCYCDGMTNLNIGASVKKIDSYAFYQCEALDCLLQIPNVLEWVGNSAFNGCRNLKGELHFPSSLWHIGDSAFRECVGFSGDLTIPHGDYWIDVAYGSFYNCSNITGIVLSDTIRNIGSWAFRGCAGVSEIVIPNNVTNISDHAFVLCDAVTDLRIGSGVKSIGNYAFYLCESLTNIVFLGDAPEIGNNVFLSVDSSCVVKVSESSSGWGVDIPGTWNGLRIEYMPSYVVTYKPGSYASGSTYTATKTSGVALTLRNATYSRTGYTQTAWSTSSAGTSRDYELGATYTVNVALTLYPYWTCNHASTSVQNARAATCTVAGYTGDTVCSTCGATIATGSTIPALGHNDGVGIVTKEPTTTEEGIMTYNCTRCGVIMRTEAIPKIVAKCPDLRFVTFRDWNFGFAMFTVANSEDGGIFSSAPVRLFNCGDPFSVVYGYANTGDAAISNVMVTTKYEMIAEDETATQTVSTATLSLDSGWGSQSAMFATSWTNLAAGVYTARVTLDAENALSDTNRANNVSGFVFAIRDPLAIGSALGYSDLVFETNGDDWYGTRDGLDRTASYARTKHLGDYGTNVLSTTVSGAGTLSFDWKVSSERNYDWLEFLVDGVVTNRISGTNCVWQGCSYELAGGNHTVEWRYRKDDSYYDGFDCAWLANVEWSPVAALPDICPYTPTGWSGALMLSTESQNATSSTATSFSPNDVIYVSHATINLGTGFSNDFRWALYVDGSLRITGANWGSGLSANGYSRWQALPIGPLSVGTHTIRVVYDYTGLVTESNESNNTVTKTVTVAGSVACPSNDNFADATVISGMSGSVTGANVNATSQSGEPLPSISAGATNTIWWTWIAPATGIAQFSTDGSKVSYTAMGAYVGSSVSALTAVAASADSYSQSSISFAVVSGTRYYIAVSGTDYRYQGTIKLNWSMFTPVPLDTALDNASLTFTTGGAANWVGVSDESYFGGSSARSGAITHSQTTWIQTEVTGEGTLSFWYKVSSESNWDKLIFYIDGVQKTVASGTVGWTRFECVISNRTQHAIKWTYSKDVVGSSGSDCCWIDKVEWVPKVVIPSVSVDASAETVDAAVDSVGFADAGVKTAIGGSAAEYAAFKSWASGVAGGEAAVVASSNAAISYMLGAERLFVSAPEIEFGECEVATATGEVTVSITVKDGEDAVAVASEKVKEMFEATSDLGDWNSAGKKLTPTVTDLTQGQANHLNFKVRPGDGTSPSAFLRIRK